MTFFMYFQITSLVVEFILFTEDGAAVVLTKWRLRSYDEKSWGRKRGKRHIISGWYRFSGVTCGGGRIAIVRARTKCTGQRETRDKLALVEELFGSLSLFCMIFSTLCLDFCQIYKKERERERGSTDMRNRMSVF